MLESRLIAPYKLIRFMRSQYSRVHKLLPLFIILLLAPFVLGVSGGIEVVLVGWVFNPCCQLILSSRILIELKLERYYEGMSILKELFSPLSIFRYTAFKLLPPLCLPLTELHPS